MKKILALTFALCMALGLAACGGGEAPAAEGDDAAAADQEAVTLKVAASPTPHAEILAQAKDALAKEGITLEVTEYNDYVIPNTAVEEGDMDVNFFQHKPYLDDFNTERGTHLVSAGAVHYEPMGVYAGKTTSIDALGDGAVIAVPNDTVNEARALLLLQDQGIIKVDPEAGLAATPNDITENPKNISFKEVEAAMLPNIVNEVDLAVINSNFALGGGLNPVEDALASEGAESEGAKTYGNIIAVKEGKENDPAVQTLVKVLQSEEMQTFINETYQGAVVPVQ